MATVASLFAVLVATILAVSQETLAYESIHAPLVKHLLEKTHPSVIPISKQGDQLEVSVQVGIQSIEDVDYERNFFESSVWVSQIWQTGLAWDPKEYNGVDRIILPKIKLWTPELVIRNTASSPVSYSPPTVILMSDGTGILNDHYRILLNCDVSETCHITFVCWKHSKKYILINGPEKSPIDLSEFFGKWENNDARFQAQGGKYEKPELERNEYHGSIDVLRYNFRIRDTHAHYRRGPSQLMFKWN